MSDAYTEDLGDFGFRELKMASELLNAYINDPNGIDHSDGLKLAFNMNSGYVFLTDEDYRDYMLNGNDKLEEYLHCSYCGHEGFREEFKDQTNCKECNRIYKQGYFTSFENEEEDE